eukprot:CAMPEP_0175047786 /NCGR_PEP_ID=MMETSP0052_2-20121109/5799_1 /TAXON_ID=51329 ORGANISM="Polytomella parva, Strain SAG 63-3" /NCGR_SAMPLE_ID=MMETSP0052_2 /ASSEMBLY_ACC=CAM_ASM_000194 /LENGTH=692 /DNA_ID=CAMNT_0016311721 /DNA_START=44 /DNA_END=2119 /DNA_ORIENTATION=+
MAEKENERLKFFYLPKSILKNISNHLDGLDFVRLTLTCKGSHQGVFSNRDEEFFMSRLEKEYGFSKDVKEGPGPETSLPTHRASYLAWRQLFDSRPDYKEIAASGIAPALLTLKKLERKTHFVHHQKHPRQASDVDIRMLQLLAWAEGSAEFPAEVHAHAQAQVVARSLALAQIQTQRRTHVLIQQSIRHQLLHSQSQNPSLDLVREDSPEIGGGTNAIQISEAMHSSELTPSALPLRKPQLQSLLSKSRVVSTEEELDKLEEDFEIQLPPELRLLYRIVPSDSKVKSGLFGFMGAYDEKTVGRLLPLSRVRYLLHYFLKEGLFVRGDGANVPAISNAPEAIGLVSSLPSSPPVSLPFPLPSDDSSCVLLPFAVHESFLPLDGRFQVVCVAIGCRAKEGREVMRATGNGELRSDEMDPGFRPLSDCDKNVGSVWISPILSEKFYSPGYLRRIWTSGGFLQAFDPNRPDTSNGVLPTVPPLPIVRPSFSPSLSPLLVSASSPSTAPAPASFHAAASTPAILKRSPPPPQRQSPFATWLKEYATRVERGIYGPWRTSPAEEQDDNGLEKMYDETWAWDEQIRKAVCKRIPHQISLYGEGCPATFRSSITGNLQISIAVHLTDWLLNLNHRLFQYEVTFHLLTCEKMHVIMDSLAAHAAPPPPGGGEDLEQCDEDTESFGLSQMLSLKNLSICNV